ncbi:hypothetical protein M0R45_038300 [Rubus argutus]|uniref:Uncharacterized protein n=1 Tax=Rubus argutus TaxID=59490 RepID=A0AAW1W561_RUBAR
MTQFFLSLDIPYTTTVHITTQRLRAKPQPFLYPPFLQQSQSQHLHEAGPLPLRIPFQAPPILEPSSTKQTSRTLFFFILLFSLFFFFPSPLLIPSSGISSLTILGGFREDWVFGAGGAVDFRGGHGCGEARDAQREGSRSVVEREP